MVFGGVPEQYYNDSRTCYTYKPGEGQWEESFSWEPSPNTGLPPLRQLISIRKLLFFYLSDAGPVMSVGPLREECFSWGATVQPVLHPIRQDLHPTQPKLQQLCFNQMVLSATGFI